MVASVCNGTHVYSSVPAPTIVVTATDDDSGVGTHEIGLRFAAKPAKVTGGGWFMLGSERVNFGLVATAKRGVSAGQIQVRLPDRHRFHGTDARGLVSNGTTATWTGNGRYDGVDGYSYSVTVFDAGARRRLSRDTFSVTIRDEAGNVVFSAGGDLKGGNICVR